MNDKAMKITKKWQGGFTLVEIAIVLMIIGLLIGGMLRGQELITSARVRNIIDQKNAIQTAHLGFMDRYRMLPGDLTAAQAAIVGNGATGGGWGGDGGFTTALHSALYFQNLVAAGFLSCANCTALATGVASVANSPVNVFGGVVRVGMESGTVAGTPASFYSSLGVAPVRLIMSTGGSIDSAILKEVDLKSDDGLPGTGNLRFGNFDANAGMATCVIPIPLAVGLQWAVPTAVNCEGVWLL
jgi:prepilin-type N-terminal cleavage/methylation domain-containing protein